MNRSPYQDPQTSMERHITDLVKHLSTGTDTRSGFAQKVEAALAHAFALEAEHHRLVEENRKLEDALTVGLIPTFSANWRETDPMLPTHVRFLDWEMEKIRWRAVMRPYQAEAQGEIWCKMRRAALRSIVRRVREQFQKTFPVQPFNAR